MTLGKEIILVDTVNFTGLTPGEEYILKGSVMDKTTGEVLIQKKPDEPDIPPQILGIHPGNKGMYLIMLLAVSGLVGALLLILKKKQKSEVQPE